MKLIVNRVRPSEPFKMPEKFDDNSGILYLSRPIILKPKCSGLALTNTILKPAKEAIVLVMPMVDFMRRRGLVANPKIITSRNPAEISIPIWNHSDSAVTLKTDDEILAFYILPACPEIELIFRV